MDLMGHDTTFPKQMSSLLGRKINIRANIVDLFNRNRSIGHCGELFLQKCLEAGLISITCFQLKQARNWLDLSEKKKWMSDEVAKTMAIRNRVLEVREYPQEKDSLLEPLANLLYQIRRMKKNVDLSVSLNDYSRFANPRMSVSEWNLFISPETQTIRDLLISLVQKEQRVWVVTKRQVSTTLKEIPIVYVINKKDEFYETYERYKELSPKHVMETFVIRELFHN